MFLLVSYMSACMYRRLTRLSTPTLVKQNEYFKSNTAVRGQTSTLQTFILILYFISPYPSNTHPSVAPGDYGALTNFSLGPFNNDVRQLSFNVSIVNDDIPEDTEMFRVRLVLDPADRARLGNRVTVSPDVATFIIQDSDGKLM